MTAVVSIESCKNLVSLTIRYVRIDSANDCTSWSKALDCTQHRSKPASSQIASAARATVFLWKKRNFACLTYHQRPPNATAARSGPCPVGRELINTIGVVIVIVAAATAALADGGAQRGDRRVGGARERHESCGAWE